MKYLIVIFIVFSTQIQAMNENEFVKRLENTHPFFTEQDFSKKIKQTEKDATFAIEDWTIGASINHKKEDYSNSINSSYNDLHTNSIDISASKKFINSGSDITLSHALADKSRDINTTSNSLSLDYSYPLMKNFGGVNDKLSTDLATISIQINNLEQQEAKENFILINLKKFIDLVYAQEQLLINKQRLTLASQELELVNKKFVASVAEKVDVLLQEDAYQRIKQQLLQAQQDLDLARYEVAIILDVDFTTISAESNIYEKYNFNAGNLKELLKNNARVLKTLDLNKKLLDRQLKTYKNQSQAQLDLNLGLSTKGENTNYINSIESQSQSWNVGLGFSYPLGATENKTDIQKTYLELAKLEEQKQEELLDIYVKARTTKQKIKSLTKMLESYKAQIKIAKDRTIEQRERYTNGNGEATFVINAQDNEQSIQIGYLQVARNYQKAVLDFKAVIDKLVQ